MKSIKNGTIILIIGVIGLLAVIGAEIYIHYQYNQPVKSYTPQQIAAMEIEPININTASVESLSALPGLSQKQAQSIVDYREENGAFENAGDIVDIKGIGEKTYRKIAYFITAE